MDGEETESQTALMPKDIMGECKVGDTMTFKVTHIYDDEVAVEPVKAAKPTETKPMSADEEIDMMATEKE